MAITVQDANTDLTPTTDPMALQVPLMRDPVTGRLLVSASLSGGGGDASAALQKIQTSQIASLTSIETAQLTVLQASQLLESIQTSQLSSLNSLTTSQLGSIQSLVALETLQTSQLSALTSGAQTAALLASEAHTGQVGGTTVRVTATPTVTASSAYATGNTLGGLLTISGATRIAAGSGVIQSVVLNLKSAQTTATDVIFFSANPSGTTVTDKTAVAVAVADFDKILGAVSVSNWTNTGTTSVGTAANVGLPFALASGTSIYAILVTRGTPTFTATTDVSLSIRILQD